MNHLYRVTATHVAPEYQAMNKPVLVRRDRDGTFSATANPYGCGKDAASAEAAIRSLLEDNACRIVLITGPHHSGPGLALCDFE